MNNSSNSDKKAILLEFISIDDIYVCVNALDEGVLLPKNLKNNLDLRLVLSLKFVNKPVFHDDCIEAILLFGGVPRKCVLPYEAIWGVYSSDLKRLYFWQEHMPEEVVSKISRFQLDQQKEGGNTPMKKVVKSSSPQGNPEALEGAQPQEGKRKKPTLTVIENKKSPETKGNTPKARSRSHLKVLK